MNPADEIILADTLAEARKKVPPGYYCLERFAEDDLCIVEVGV